jgi:hypothetical protein
VRMTGAEECLGRMLVMEEHIMQHEGQIAVLYSQLQRETQLREGLKKWIARVESDVARLASKEGAAPPAELARLTGEESAPTLVDAAAKGGAAATVKTGANSAVKARAPPPAPTPARVISPGPAGCSVDFHLDCVPASRHAILDRLS